MKLNSKVTGGLAWAGLFLILAVPSAEMLSKPSAFQATTGSDADSTAAVADSEVEVVKTARVVAPKPATRSARPAATATERDVVEEYVASGKKLPSYISDAPGATSQPKAPATAESETPAAPATTVKLVSPSAPATAAVNSDGGSTTGAGKSPATDKITTASVDSVQVTPPPIPYPASMRPASRPSTAATANGPLIIDEDSVARRELAVRTVEPFLVDEPRIIEGEELEEWDSGSLADYLERRGLISGSNQAARDFDREYDEDGFFLSDGPNSRRRLVGRPVDDWELF